MTAPKPPDKIEDYRLEARIGQGAMGHVFRARDEALQRDVAVKFMSDELAAQPSARERFRTEARAAARIQHPSVAQVYKVGEHDGVPFMVSEFVRGRSLDTFEGGLPWREAARYGADLARGLAAAHACGVLHRDIKPSNAIATDDGVKLIDFGLAKLAPEAPREDLTLDPDAPPNLTRSGAVMGTPYYMPPEAWRGEAATVRSDVYSLGALLYELASGSPPHGRIRTRELQQIVQVNEPRPLAERLGTADAEAFAAVVDRCLRIAPEQRIHTAAELAELLASVTAPIEADPRSERAAAELDAARVLVVHAHEEADAVAFARDVLLPYVAQQTGRSLVRVQARTAADVEAALTIKRRDDATVADAPLFEEPPPEEDEVELRRDVVVLVEGGAHADASWRSTFERLTPNAWLVLPVATSAVPPLSGALAAAVFGLDPERKRSRWPWLLVAAMGIASAAAVWVADAPSDVRIEDLERVTFEDGCEEFPSLTPDGERLLYDAELDGRYALILRDLVSGRAEPITGSTEGWEFAPAVSPDGARFAYIRRTDGVSRAYVATFEAPTKSREIAVGRLRPSWTPDGRAVWAGPGTKPQRFDLATSTVTRTLTPPPETQLLHLREIPDGRIVAIPFAEDISSVGRGLVIYEGDTPKWLFERDVLEVLEVLEDQALVAHRTQSEKVQLWRVPFDGTEPTPLSAGGVEARAGLAVRGDRIVWSNCRIEQKLTALADEEGEQAFVPLVKGDWSDYEPAAVPGTDLVLALSLRSGKVRIWEIDLSRKRPARMLETGAPEPVSVAVSPDGTQVAFGTESDGIFVMPRDGSAAPKLAVKGAHNYYPSFTADGRALVYQSENKDGLDRIDVVPLDGGPTERLLDANAADPAVSVDGKTVAFVLETDPDNELGHVVLFDRATKQHERLTMELDAGWYHNLRFSPDGERLLLLESGTKLYEVDLASKKVVNRRDAGANQFMGVTYRGDDIVLGFMQWSGDLWSGRLRVGR